MNINDRRRVSALIEAEFASRRNAVRIEVTEAAKRNKVEQLLKQHKLDATVRKLVAARKVVENLERSLSVACSTIWPSEKPRYSGCECHEDYEDIVLRAAEAVLIDDGGQAAKLRAEERKLLAKVEIASTLDDLQKILKSAGLV